MRALVTGPDGVVGRALVAALEARGDDVVALRRRPTPAPNEVVGDLLDAASLERALAAGPFAAVFHLAAQSLVGEANRAPLETFEVNVAGTWRLLEACRTSGVERVVVASSEKAYGPAGTLPHSEADPLDARHPYDVSKACADLVARSFHHTFGLEVAVARLPNVYGPGDANRSRLVPELVGAVLAGRPPAIRSDGSPRRDFLHAEDAAGAYLAIESALAAGEAGGEAFNAGGGRSHAVREVVDTLLAGTGLEARYAVAPPAGELLAEWVDPAKLRAATGWAPRIDLEDGLRSTLAWYRTHPEVLA